MQSPCATACAGYKTLRTPAATDTYAGVRKGQQGQLIYKCAVQAGAHDNNLLLKTLPAARHRIFQAGRHGYVVLEVSRRAHVGTTSIQDDTPSQRADINTAALNHMYPMYACVCLVERGWRFGLPLLLASIKGGFQTVAIVGFVAPFAVSLLGPLVGHMLDATHRQFGLSLVLMLQNCFIILSGLIMLRAEHLPAGVSLQSSSLFPWLLVMTMAERLAALASEVAVERDWIVQLAGSGNAGTLAACNAKLRRMDLLSELAGTLLFGLAVSTLGAPRTLVLLILGAGLSIPFELFHINQIARLLPDMMIREHHQPVAALMLTPWRRRDATALTSGLQRQRLLHMLTEFKGQAAVIVSGWRLYARQPIVPASAAYVLLFFNAVLSPGGLMTAFLASRGLSGTAAAMFRGGCALMGFVGTWVGRHLIATYGLLHAGIVALAFQSSCLVAATCMYRVYLAPAPSIPLEGGAAAATGMLGHVTAWPVAVGLFCGLIIVSRIGLWSYDMVDAQIFQTAVDPKEAASVSAAEISLCNIMELCMLGIAAVAASPAMFGSLVTLSVGAVLTSLALYTSWVVRGGAAAVMQRAADTNTVPQTS